MSTTANFFIEHIKIVKILVAQETKGISSHPPPLPPPNFEV
jgi:hypothetical protein